MTAQHLHNLEAGAVCLLAFALFSVVIAWMAGKGGGR